MQIIEIMLIHITIQTPESLILIGFELAFEFLDTDWFASVSSIDRDRPCIALPRNGRTDGGRHLAPDSLTLEENNRQNQ